MSGWARAAGAPPLVLGHRGASAHAVENTMPAFARAAADGADGVELDVRLDGDGGMVVFHDDDLARLGGRPERIDRLRGTALAAVRLSGEPIPRLEQVLGDLPGLLVNVEIKSRGPLSAVPLVRAVRATLARTGAADRVVVSSFDPTAVTLTRALAPRLKVGLLVYRDQSRRIRGARLPPFVHAYAVHPERALIDRDQMARWRGKGLAVHTWTVDGADEVRRVALLGVDAIITNDPRATRDALR